MATSEAYKRRQARSAYEYWYPKRLDNLHSAYPTRYSEDKADAWAHCKKVCEEFNGRGLGVLSHNGYQFTAGFRYTSTEGKEMFYYITRSYEVAIEVED